ncbi:MAG TPA: FKBP-type peptidyl-prolyl cis-trans isomerase [Jatrophihabitantaceae bacterium]
MTTNKQRRDAARRQLERQLQRRQVQEAARKRRTLIATIAGTIILAVVVVIVVVAVVGSGDDKKKPAANGSPSGSGTPTPSPSTTPSPTPSTSYPPAKGASVAFDGVTVKGAADLKGAPGVTSKSSKNPAKLEYKDLVVGKGETPTAKSTATIQYVGALYKNGTVFDSSWQHGQTASFPLAPGSVIDGFSQGILGITGVPPMKVGGRRIIIMPAALGYGATPPQGSNIPANSPLVFVVDLTKIAATPASSAPAS